MSEFSGIADKLKTFVKEKPAVAGAIGIGIVGGVYLLSRSGGGLSLGSGSSAPGAAAGQTAAGQTGQSGQGGASGSGDGSDLAGLANQLAESQSQNAGAIGKLQDALGAVVKQFNDALGQQQQANQTGLSQLAAQTNQALSGFSAQQQQTIPDFAGFASQLQNNLQQQLNAFRVAPTGQLQQFTAPSIVSPTVTQFRLPANFSVAQGANQFGQFAGSFLRSLPAPIASAYHPAPRPTPAPSFNLNAFANQIGRFSGSFLTHLPPAPNLNYLNGIGAISHQIYLQQSGQIGNAGSKTGYQ